MEICKAKSDGNHITGHFRFTISQLQRRWNDKDRERWTARLIQGIRPWIGRKFGEMSYYVTQMLLRHGYFRKYPHRMVKTCCLCEEGELIDDAEHTVVEYARWQRYHYVLTSIIRRITAANIVGIMMACRESWASVTNYMQHFL